MSRGHPGKSEVYRLKLVTRAKREVERNFLQQAKSLFFQLNPDKNPTKCRSAITKIKKQLMGEQVGI